MSYEKEASNLVDHLLAAPPPDRSQLTAEEQLPGFITLIQVLESALLIVQKRYHQDPPDLEPFPGAVAAVVRQSLRAIDMLREAGVQPPRSAK